MYNLNKSSSSTRDSQIDDPSGCWNWMLGLLEVAEAKAKRVKIGCYALVIGPELQNIGVVEGAVFLLASQI